MKKILLAVAVLFGAGYLWAQQAYVVELSAADTKDVKQAWEQLQSAQRHWDFVNKRVRYDYLTVSYRDPESSSQEIPNDFAGVTQDSGLTGLFIISSCDESRSITTSSGYVEVAPESETCKKQHAEEQTRREKARYLRQGWNNGFEFSKDFKYIVPKPPEEPRNPSYGILNVAPASGVLVQ